MKTAFVTGSSRGIGKGIAIELAELGYRLALVATNREKLEEVAQEITQTLHLDKSQEPLIFSLNVVSIFIGFVRAEE
jgi:short-subunit dehydrogenase